MEPYCTKMLFDLSHTAAAPLLAAHDSPWEVLPKIRDFILELGKSLAPQDYDRPAEDIWVEKSAEIAPSASLKGPLVIGAGTQVRHCAFIRGGVLVGGGCVIGNSVEVKNSIIFDGCQIPHFNYVGDSILGYGAHMGAGSITSNIKSDRTDVTIAYGSARINTGLRKMGAMIGDGTEIGCNSVLNPGCVIGAGTTIYPLSSVRGFVPGGHIYKGAGKIVKKDRTQDAY